MAGIIANPIAHLAKVGPPVKKLSREQKAIARRMQQFEAQRAQEGQMGVAIQDLNPGVTHQTKATFRPGKSNAPAAPPQPTFQPPPKVPKQHATVQRVARQLDMTGASAEPDGFAELEAELGGVDGEEGTVETATAPEADLDVDEVLKRFKGSPDEIAKQLAKSYSASEKRMRQLEAEKQMLLKGQTAQPVQQTTQPVPQTNQIQVQPQFNYKRFKDDILDHGDEVAKEFEQHLSGTMDQRVAQFIAPLYEKALEHDLLINHGDVVNRDNLDLIKAMAQNEPGQNRMEKLASAVAKYKTSMPTHTPHELPEVQAMQRAAQTPAPQGRTGGEKKMFKQSYLRDLIDAKVKTGEYARDPKWRRLVDTAYREGRVLRGQ